MTRPKQLCDFHQTFAEDVDHLGTGRSEAAESLRFGAIGPGLKSQLCHQPTA